MEAIMKITEQIHALKHTFFIPVHPELKIERFVYSFVVFGNENVYLIDSGIADSKDKILNYVEKNGYSKNNITTLILTHSHPDHIGSARSIKDITECQVLAHEGEKGWIEDVDKQFSDRPVPGFKSFVNKSVKINRFLNDS
ncbi:MAG: MBL fold metallo-hydrolase, partial [Candidatus Omnitrophota bacterium]|nr:MBL fold metallo-hydrolase [Candidatus Omnitrophota bacterium]